MSAAAPRRVEREWLDELPADDPRALASRRDLRRLNALMANAGIVVRSLRGTERATIAEIGAGDGRFALRLVASLPLPRRAATITLVDRQAIVEAQTLRELAEHGWGARVFTADVFDWLETPGLRYDAIVANLFLHHFKPEALERLLALVARRTRCFVACEPRRSSLAAAGSHLLGAIGCNDVTRHDAVVSVRAGFRDGEISALWPADAAWRLDERARGLFSHAFTAMRA